MAMHYVKHDPKPERRTMTYREVSERTGLTYMTVINRVRKGVFVAVENGNGPKLVTAESVDKFLARKKSFLGLDSSL